MMGKTSAHIRYRNKYGDIVPGVTTILGVLNKPALVPWANKLGLQGIDSSKFRDEKAEIGSLAHAMILAHLTGKEPDTSDYSENQVDRAETCFLKFLDWQKQYPWHSVLAEMPFVSEKYQFGGTLDQLAKEGDRLILLDYKTGSGIFDEAEYQLASYALLLAEQGYKIDEARILRFGRDDNEGFDQRVINDLTQQQAIFLDCLDIYNRRKILKG